jgi:hypothetical protein
LLTMIEAVVPPAGLLSPVLHNRAPEAVVDKVVVPQLFVTDTTGVAGRAVGAATLLPARLVQPLTVCVTV